MKPHKLGNVNAASRAVVLKKGKLVGYCIDTPNSAAYAMNKTGGDEVKGCYMEYKRGAGDMDERIEHAGWFKNDQEAYFQAV